MTKKIQIIKENFNYAKKHNTLGLGWENGIEELINVVEELEEVINKTQTVLENSDLDDSTKIDHLDEIYYE